MKRMFFGSEYACFKTPYPPPTTSPTSTTSQRHLLWRDNFDPIGSAGRLNLAPCRLPQFAAFVRATATKTLALQQPADTPGRSENLLGFNEVLRLGCAHAHVWALKRDFTGVDIWILFKIFITMPATALFFWWQVHLLQRYRLPAPAMPNPRCAAAWCERRLLGRMRRWRQL